MIAPPLLLGARAVPQTGGRPPVQRTCFICHSLPRNPTITMPRGFTKKEERQYEHIKESEEKQQGRPEEDAERIAAATVNKQRKEKGETKEQKGER